MSGKGGVVDFSFCVTEQNRDSANGLLRHVEGIFNEQVLASGNTIRFGLPQELDGPNGRGLSKSHYSETFEIQVSIKIVQVIRKAGKSI